MQFVFPGSSALKIAMMSINLSKNDGVIVPAITFIATINAAKNITKNIIISDVDPSFGCITKEKLIDALNIAKKKKNKSKVFNKCFLCWTNKRFV